MTKADRIDWIYDTVDDLLLADNFTKVDTMLRELDLDDIGLSIAEMLSYLTVTLYAADQLDERTGFYDRVRARLLVLDPARTDELLRGLSADTEGHSDGR